MTDSLTCQQLRQVLNERVAEIQSLQQQLGDAMVEFTPISDAVGQGADVAQTQVNRMVELNAMIASLVDRIQATQQAIANVTAQMGAARCM